MSNCWDLLCRTCDDTCLLGWNRGGDRIQQLIPLLPDIAKMRPVEEILPAAVDFPANLLHFAERHHGHDLIAIDEYGAFHGGCIHQYKCRCCSTQVHCRKPRDHPGDCGPDGELPGIVDVADIVAFADWLREDLDGAADGVSSQVLKVAAEAGEVSQAWYAYTGRDPWNAQVPLDDVVGEFADVAIAALVGIARAGDSPADVVARKLAIIRTRCAATSATNITSTATPSTPELHQ